MKFLPLLLMFFVLSACHKHQNESPVAGCDMQKVYAENAVKVTITNGIWGTVSNTEGNCMPMVPPSTGSCRTCPAQRTVRVYDYTLISQATPAGTPGSFYSSFSTTLIAETTADANGFYQVSLPPGHYTVVIVEEGKLYANLSDGWGGLNPVTVTTGKQNLNLEMTYKAVY